MRWRFVPDRRRGGQARPTTSASFRYRVVQRSVAGQGQLLPCEFETIAWGRPFRVGGIQTLDQLVIGTQRRTRFAKSLVLLRTARTPESTSLCGIPPTRQP